MLTQLASKVFGTKHERDIRRIMPIVEEINRHYETFGDLPDDAFGEKTRAWRTELHEAFKAELEPARERERERLATELDVPSLVDAELGVWEREFAQKFDWSPYLDEILPEAFAAVKETCRRHAGQSWPVVGIAMEWEMVPFDVQLIGAVVLHQGKIAEMATGEGKTLVAVMPAYLNALTGRGVHIVTTNDFLARRDREWMGPIYEFLGVTVDCVQEEQTPHSGRRRGAYQADITYGTNNGFGFDYLRDNMGVRLEDTVQRSGYTYAIIDEVDSILIDEARTPLIISGPVTGTSAEYGEMKPQVDRVVREQTRLVNRLVSEAEKALEEKQDYEAGIKLLAAQRGAPKNKRLLKLQQEEGIRRLITRVEKDFMIDKRMPEIDDMLYFSIDEKGNVADLSEGGRQLFPNHEELFLLPDLAFGIEEIEENPTLSPQEKLADQEALHRDYAEKNERVHSINQLLRAYSLFEKDVGYVVQDGRVIIVDEFTGRLQPGRRYSDGLHQALEAKEGVKVEGETQTLATITIQNYFRMYQKLAGMTGTAETEAREFYEIYKLDVVVIPTNVPVRRLDQDDVIFRTRREKYSAIIEEIIELHKEDLPVLVGTTSVEVSEMLSRMLKRHIPNHQVLNAKYHQREAEIIRLAGQPGAVTIATNMAGRGQDIKLGPGVAGKGGLQIIGSERHEARRIDRQLRGRSGRQGDPGASRFFLSLEDDLMRLFGSERIATIMDKLGAQEGEVIEHRMVTRAIDRAQRRVEAHNFDIRKHLLEYDDVMNQQREVIYARRRRALEGDDLRGEVAEMIETVVGTQIESHAPPNTYPEDWDLAGLRSELRATFLIELALDLDEAAIMNMDVLRDAALEQVSSVYARRDAELGPELLRALERYAVLTTIDEQWKEHLHEMDILKEGIGLRGYGQRDPLIEYKREGFEMFSTMLDRIDGEVLKVILLKAVVEPPPVRRVARQPQVVLSHDDTWGMGFDAVGGGEGDDYGEPVASGRPAGRARREPVRVGVKVGRNDPCPCGSGLKYKKCCGK